MNTRVISGLIQHLLFLLYNSFVGQSIILTEIFILTLCNYTSFAGLMYKHVYVVLKLCHAMLLQSNFCCHILHT